MMAVPVYLGDEVSAAGYRLAGALVRTPPAGDETAALAWARAQAPLVLVSAPVAAGIAAGALRAALAALTPLVLIVPDLRGEVPLPDLAARLRAQLGLEA
jgi:vacuolar-type H+-ATPase subunit F/Vma7